MKIIIISAIAFLASSTNPGNNLIGRWETKPSATGTVTGVNFKTDGTFDGFLNKKPFTSGQYTFENGVFAFTDNGCDGKKGIYKVIFFSNNDSLRVEPISDSCDERREGMKRMILGRVKE